MDSGVAAGTTRGESEVWLLRLYVAGQSPRSLTALSNLHEFCELHLAGHYDIETVDLVEHPERAREDDIVAIPTVVRRQPTPVCRVIGDLSEPGRLRAGLHLRQFSSR